MEVFKGLPYNWWFWGKEKHYNQCLPISEPTKHWGLIPNSVLHREFWFNSVVYGRKPKQVNVLKIFTGEKGMRLEEMSGDGRGGEEKGLNKGVHLWNC